jgi:glucokinase
MTRLFAAVDLGGTSIKAAIANAAGEVLAHQSSPTESHEGPDAVVARIAELVVNLFAQINVADKTLAGVGMGVPGLVDLETGTTKFLPNLPTQWRDIPVAAKLQQQLHCPVRLLNDVRTATLGELRFGHGMNNPATTMAFFSLGTGVGGGVAVDGKIRLGPLGAAGELGHQTIIADGPRCGCGNRGCLETLASGPAIAAEGVRLMRMGLAPNLHKLVAGDDRRVTTREMMTVANQDAPIREAIVTAATYLGIAAANVVTVLHPDLVVLGGGVAEIGDLLIDTVREVVRNRVGMFPTDEVRIVKSLLGEQAGLIGAVALAIEAAGNG